MTPLLYFDTETTGTNVAKDRIVELAIYVDDETWDEDERPLRLRFNPEIPIPEEATAIHGIRNGDVQDAPPFHAWARELYHIFQGRDLAGYNILNFDVPILWEEFHRARIQWDLTGINIIDACKIFRTKEERTLEYAARFYCDSDHGAAHTAMADVLMTRRVFLAQRERYKDLAEMTKAELSRFCGTEDRVDLAGKIVRNKEGVPVYAFGKSKDLPVLRDPSYAEWMIRSDFPENTKLVLRDILKGKIK